MLMLALTPRALAVLADTLTERGIPGNVGIRISAGGANGDGAAFHLQFADDPAPDDVVIDSGGPRIFVAAEVAKPLEAAIIDAEETALGRKLIVRYHRDA
jgi:Fe-S cluster assembly iron-binding protein IscA